MSIINTKAVLPTGSAFRLIPFDPIESIPVEFTADFASTVLTDTTIGSTNDETSPQIEGVWASDVNYESATCSGVNGGTFSIDITIPNVSVILASHDNTFDITQFVGVSDTTGLGCAASFIFGSCALVNQTDNAGVTLDDPDLLAVSIADNVMTCGDISLPVDTSLFTLTTLFVTQDVAAGIPADVPTLTFTNGFFSASSPAELPDDLADFDVLQIINNPGTILDKDVLVDDWCTLYDSQTKIRIQREPT